MSTIGEAEVSVVADGTTFGPSLRKLEGPVGRSGQAMGKTLGLALKRGVQLSMAAVGAIVSVALVKGFQRLKSIDDARGKLIGLGHSAKDVKTIMGDALKSVKGTAFGLGDAATIAANAVASGVKPGKELERTLKITADTATIAGTSLEEMGGIFTQVSARGRVATDDIQQLQDRGVPAMKFLADQFGVTQAKAAEMVTKGKVSFNEFQSAMEKGLGGAAQASGKTFTGALANVGAALSRFGASVLQGVFSQMPGLFETVIAWVDKLAGKGDALGKLLGDGFKKAWDALQLFVQSPEGQQLLADLVQIGKDLGTIFLQSVAPAFETLYGVLSGAGLTSIQILKDVLGWMADHGPLVSDLIVVLASAIGILTTAVKIYTAVQWLLNIAMDANPIGILILAIGLLITAFVLLWRNSETVRNVITHDWEVISGVVLAAWGFIKEAARAVADWFMNTLVPFFQGVWDAIVAGATGLWEGIKAVWDAIVGAATWLWQTVSGFFIALANQFLIMATAISNFYHTWIAPIFELFGAIAKWLWEAVLKVVFAFIEAEWRGLGIIWRAVYNTVIKPVIDFFAARWKDFQVGFAIIKALVAQAFRALGDGIRFVYNTVIKPIIDFFQKRWQDFLVAYNIVKDAVMRAFGAVGTKISDVYNKTIKPVLDAFKKAIKAVQDAFNVAKDAIAKAWQAIADAAKKPVKFVIQTVINDTLIAGFNKMAKTFKTTELPTVKLPAGFYGGGPTGRGDRHSIAGPVHFNEHVVTADEVSKTPGGHGTWAALRGLAAKGQLWKLLPGHFLGGTPPVSGGARRHSGYPWATWAGDFSAGTGTPVHAWASGRVAKTAMWNYSYGHHIRINHPGNRQTLYAHLRDILVHLGEAVGNGQVIAHSDSTGNSTGPHLHFELKGSQGTGGGALSGTVGAVVSQIIDHGKEWFNKFASPAKDMLKKAGDSQWAKVVIGMGARTIDDMFKYVKSLPGAIERIFGFGSSSGVAGSDPGTGGNRAIGKRMMLASGWAASQWPALNSLWTRESGWRTTAKNPSSGAYGIPQSLPASKMRSAGADYLTNPVTQIKWGLGYIKSRYGSPGGAWAHSQRTGWYDSGGMLPVGWSAAVNGTNKPEPVLTDRQWSDIHELAQRGAAATQGAASNIYVTMNVSVDDLAKMSKLGDFVDMLQMARVNSRKTLRSGTVSA